MLYEMNVQCGDQDDENLFKPFIPKYTKLKRKKPVNKSHSKIQKKRSASQLVV